MFNDECGLTQAVLDGRKTMTRRGCKYDRPNETYDIVFPVFEPNDYDNDGNIVSPLNYAFGWKNDKGDFTGWNIPQYKVGEVVAVAQCYKSLGMNPEIALDDKDGIGFYTKTKFAPGWKNKMFVRADLMPHHIRITDIKIERLQNISDEDCLKEGKYVGVAAITANKGVCLNPCVKNGLYNTKYKPLSAYRSEVIGNIYDNPDLIK